MESGPGPASRRDRAEFWLDVVADLHRQPLRELPHDMIAAALTTSFESVATADHRRTSRGVEQRVISPGTDPERWREVIALAPERATDVPLLRWYLITGETAAQHSGAVSPELTQIGRAHV